MQYAAIAVYILASKPYGTLYIGVTSDLIKRVYEHRTEAIPGFTKRYHIHKLIYYELYEDMPTAIHREKRLKKYKREQKTRLIESMNPHWNDLYAAIYQ